jgi:hypothetical protein
MSAASTGKRESNGIEVSCAANGAHRRLVFAGTRRERATLFHFGAHADSCQVDAKVMRDGIVSLPLAPDPNQIALDLVPAGIVRDPVHDTRHAIWRVLNGSSTSYRAQLQTPDGLIIPFLARALSETILRSDSLEGAASHVLVVSGAPIDQAIISSASFADARPLTDAECLFDGNP